MISKLAGHPLFKFDAKKLETVFMHLDNDYAKYIS